MTTDSYLRKVRDGSKDKERLIMGRFQGKRILITGGTSGMGLAGALRIVSEGGDVAITGLNDERLKRARSLLPESSLILKNDAASEADISVLQAAISGWGSLDGLWLNAGFAEVGAPESVTADAFNRMMNANVRGPMLQLAALSGSLNSGASVLVTSSSSVYEGAAMTSLYAATKGAVVAMVKSWASALAVRGFAPIRWYRVRLKRTSDISCRKSRVSSLRILLSARSPRPGRNRGRSICCRTVSAF